MGGSPSIDQVGHGADGITTYPLSSVQQAVWLDQTVNRTVANYNIGIAVQLDGEFDVPSFETAMALVADRNDALRLVLCDGFGIARQKVLPSTNGSVQLIDFASEPDGDARAREHLHRKLVEPLDMYGPVLLDTEVIRANGSRYYLLRRYHHLVTDGFGVSLIGDAVIDLYNLLRA